MVQWACGTDRLGFVERMRFIRAVTADLPSLYRTT